jgi:hypothetical protein
MEGEMIMHAAALIGTGTAGFLVVGAAGFLVGGAAGAVAGVLACTVFVIAWWLWTRNAQALPGPAGQPRPSACKDFDEIVERLNDLAHERNWDLGKHYAIAHMACENRTITFDELERRYDRGVRSERIRQIRQDFSEAPKNDGSR